MAAAIHRALRWLTAAAMVVAILSTLSYASDAHMALRFFAPAAGAWWNANEFWFMEGAAAGLGLLIAIRLGARVVEGAAVRARTSLTALIVAAVLLDPIAQVSAAIARLGWSGRGGAFENRLAGLSGYARGSILDKLSIAGVYSLKTAAFGFLIGLALFLLVLVGWLGTRRAGEDPESGAAAAGDENPRFGSQGI